MSWTLASHSTTIPHYRDLHERNRTERGLYPKNNLRFHYYNRKIPDFKVANTVMPQSKLDSSQQQPKVCIIGAGMSGLFTALLLQKAGIKDITILECQDRVGGRVHTKYFPGKKKEKLYGELGAMRLPITAEHQMVFDTINYLNKQNNEEHRIQLIDFIFTDKQENGLYCYNDSREESGRIMTQKYANDPTNFHTLDFPLSISPNYKKLFAESMQYYFDLLNKNFDEGIKELMKVDKHSVHSYLEEVFLPEKLNESLLNKNFDKKIKKLMKVDKHNVSSYIKEVFLPGKLYEGIDIDQTISAMEMTESATGYFRLSFVESVIDAYTFSDKSQKWKTIDYGMQRFPDAFKPIVGDYIKYKCKVFEVKERMDNGKLKLQVHWEEDGNIEKHDTYDRVIVTCPLGVVRQWKLPDNAVDYYKKRAIRELNYEGSTKIFLKFKSRFWEKTPNPIIGGNSRTDLPIRTVVYPSYYVGMPDGPAILLGSYTWANDAEKYAAYSQQENVKFCLKNLEILHGPDVLKEWDKDEKSNTSIYWTNEPTTIGGFAHFGPEQYEKLIYPMIEPKCNMHWAGEHTDIHHAWIVGALNSAVRVVKEVLLQSLMIKEWNSIKSSEPLLNWQGHLEG